MIYRVCGVVYEVEDASQIGAAMELGDAMVVSTLQRADVTLGCRVRAE